MSRPSPVRRPRPTLRLPLKPPSGATRQPVPLESGSPPLRRPEPPNYRLRSWLTGTWCAWDGFSRPTTPGAALEVINEILSLQEEHDLALGNDFPFQYARVALAAGQTETAIASLNEYLVSAGRAGAFYREALELLDSAEVRLEAEEDDRRRADVERRRAARWPPREVFRDCPECPEMVVLSGSVLALGRYEVTVGEYRAFAAATAAGAGGGCIAFGGGDSWRDPGFPQTDRHPVTCVSWEDAQAYLSWLSRRTGVAYRLPSEAEWERVASDSRAGCNHARTGSRETCPVGSYGSNAAGLSDMVGNVSEWTSDCYGDNCVRRGGDWSSAAENLQPSRRIGSAADRRDAGSGFRVARTLE